MATNRLTDRQVANAKPREKEYTLSDGNGLYLRVQACGTRTWLFRFTDLSGKQGKLSLGPYPARTLAAARVEAMKCRRQLLDGIDPRSKPQNVPRTFKQAYEQWIRESLSKRRNARGVYACGRQMKKHILPSIGGDLLTTVTRYKLISLLDTLREAGRPAQAGCILIDLVQMLNYAEGRHWIAQNPIRNLRKRDLEIVDVVRERVLYPFELVVLRNRLANPIRMTNACKAGIWLSMSTLARAGELAQLREDDIDWDQRTWFLEADKTKSKRAHLIHLSAFAFYWLCRLRESPYRTSEYLFPGTRGATHAKNTSFSHQITQRQKPDSTIEDAGTLIMPHGKWVMHDMRRTGATLMGELGVPEELIEMCLNHRTSDKSLVYTYQKQQRLDDRQAAFELLGDYLMALLGHPEDWQRDAVDPDPTTVLLPHAHTQWMTAPHLAANRESFLATRVVQQLITRLHRSSSPSDRMKLEQRLNEILLEN